jgi:tRNA(fMet)-specific endonuclease VapC
VTLSLDTNVLVDLLRGRTPFVRHRFDLARRQEAPLRLSLIVWHELMYGARRSPRPEDAEKSIRLLIQGIPIEPFSEADMLAAADVRAQLRPPMGPFDTLIAGQALSRGWTVVTANVREFSRVDGLDLEDWSRG